MPKLVTQYASAEREKPEIISQEFKLVKDYGYIREIFSNLPEVAIILNEHRQIVYSNEGLLSLLPEAERDTYLGSRPGEILNCVHSKENAGGCGTTKSCRYCGLVNSVIDSQKSNAKSIMECRVVSFIEDEEHSFDYRVTASPLSIKGKSFTMVFMTDISDEKRKIALERIFFHDIINTAGGIVGFTEFLSQVDEPESLKEYVKVVEQLSHDLLDDLQAQRALTLAEHGDLKINISDVDPSVIIEEVKSSVSYHNVAKDKEIVFGKSATIRKLATDSVLLKRVLINMAKNALEATEDKGQILMGSYDDNGRIVFYVHNDQQMSNDVQLQIFKRSFSTKGIDRGLGTYSIKLLGERYLKGKVWFESDKINGTTFLISLPNLNKN